MKTGFRLACHILVLSIFICNPVMGQTDEDLAKQSQNPLGTIISSPFENNFYFGIGPSDATAYALTWKPVYPVDLGDWNLINRFIIPAVYGEGQDAGILLNSTVDVGNGSLTDLPTGSAFGLADITYTAYLSPKKSGSWIWGIGGALGLPTATEDRFSSDKWSAGPAFVALTMPGNWVTGFLIQNTWSFAGDSDAADVNKFLFQYFVNYNLDDGWYLNTSPIITANWEA
ncbi:MAG: neuromedin U, partial [Desulforhopalus sp.]